MSDFVQAAVHTYGDEGDYTLALGFKARLVSGEPEPNDDVAALRPAAVQVLIAGDNANTATTVLGYALAILRDSSSFAPAGVQLVPPVAVEPRIWYNPELRSTLFLVPGLIAYIAMITAVASTALSIVREKEMGTMEQVRMAPLGAFSFIVGKTIPYFLLAMVSALAIVLVSMVLFDVPMRGSWLLLLLALSLFLVGALGIGLFISSVADSQQVAFQAPMLASFLPTFLLSGFIFPISSMPPFLQIVTYAVPARYFLTALRAIVLKGTGIETFWHELAEANSDALILLSSGPMSIAGEQITFAPLKFFLQPSDQTCAIYDARPLLARK